MSNLPTSSSLLSLGARMKPTQAMIRATIYGVSAVVLTASLAACTATTGDTDSTYASDYVGATEMSPARRRSIIRMQLAVGYLESEQLEIALTEANRAIQADPSHSAAYIVRGIIYNQIGDKNLAQESFRRALTINPRDGDAQHNLGMVLCDQGNFDQARRYFEAALSNPVYRNKERTHVAQAVCEAKSGDTATAESLLLAAYEDGTRSPIVANALADIYYNQKNYRRAAMYASQANPRDGASAASLWLAIKIEKQLGNQNGMQRYARQLRESFPNSRELRLFERGAWNN